MKTVAVQANLDETVDLVRKFAHDEFARAIGVETPSEQDVRGFILDRLRSMRLQAPASGEDPVVQRVFDCVYVLPVRTRVEGMNVVEARLVVMPDARYTMKVYIPVSD
ncbi:hypothetical protein PCA31118_00415 [Pandoraea captiosa]|jgi:hypothetical protein|uniref:Uncharacterized protein n=1 Tax=Pandoraea captiosa TaxID=2508302 RepID=A0A5E4ZL52_9BURK|nr:hypothetical protein [Pandoraea captiosa]VVE60963.1 hypothetical protein PCA31118_00415 [Pandoraea captiosa]